MKRRIGISAIASFGFLLPAWASAQADAPQEAYARGLVAHHGGDYETAIEEFGFAAERGHADAQFRLGVMHGKGRGVPSSFAEEVIWQRKAAEQGHFIAQFNLGTMFRRGESVARDYFEALKPHCKGEGSQREDCRPPLESRKSQ